MNASQESLDTPVLLKHYIRKYALGGMGSISGGMCNWPCRAHKIGTLRCSGRGRGGRQPEAKCSILGTN